VGAEIVEQIRFPYPVAPIVRSHHEKWNGTGYPDGLAGEQIPIGARILAAVDCLDALASDRQYRRALPLAEAIKVVESEAGKSFRSACGWKFWRGRYVELERQATSGSHEKAKLSTDLKIVRGDAPAAGFESTKESKLQPGLGELPTLASDGESGSVAERHLRPRRGFSVHCVARSESLFLTTCWSCIARQAKHLIPESLDGEAIACLRRSKFPLGMGFRMGGGEREVIVTAILRWTGVI